MIDRRGLIVGAGALALAGEAAAQAPADYEYIFVRLTSGGGARIGFLGYLAKTVRPAVGAAGGQILGVFTPQLGWDSNELAILMRWTGPNLGRSDIATLIQSAPQGVSLDRHRLAATARPGASDQLKPGGIYVHRWFEIKPSDREEFVRLSSEGWVDFEKRFATNIFGLFVETTPTPSKSLGLLLLTRYADHGVWEASRDPTTDAMKSFQRRAQLTLSSRGCSTLLAPLP